MHVRVIALSSVTLTIALSSAPVVAAPPKATVWNYFSARRDYNRTRDRDEKLSHREFFNYHFRGVLPTRLRPRVTMGKKLKRLNVALVELEHKAARSRSNPGNMHAFMDTVKAFNELAGQLDVAKSFAKSKEIKPPPSQLEAIRQRAVKAVGFHFRAAVPVTMTLSRPDENKAFRGALANYWVLSNNK